MILTPRRKAILTEIWRSNGLLYTTIQRAVGLTSKASMHYHLSALRRDGYVSWADGLCRTLTLTGKGLLAAQGFRLLYTCDQDGVYEVR
jgi:SOS-response transcriptional repressor LexA